MKILYTLLLLLSSHIIFANIDIVDRQVIVKLNPDYNTHNSVQNLFPTEKVEPIYKDINLWSVEFEGQIDFKKLNSLKGKNVIYSYSRNRNLSPRYTPNDTMFPLQSHHQKSIEPGQQISFGINSVDAWNFNKGAVTTNGDTIVIAVIDKGFEVSHIDLDYFTNREEIPGDSIDNDGNGFIDDYRGWNANRNNGQLDARATNHGTEIAGGAAATGDNITGVCGVAMKAKILPIGDAITIISSIKAFEYCREMKKLYYESNGTKGAYIVAVNYSIGTTDAVPSDAPEWGEAIESLCSQGIIITTAVANEFKNVVAIGDLPTLFNTSSMISTTTIAESTLSINQAAFSDSLVGLAAPNKYYTTLPGNAFGMSSSGASLSAPLVSGVIGLMYANLYPAFLDSIKENPCHYSKMLKEMVLSGTDTSSNLKGLTISGGRLSAYNSVKKASELRLNDDDESSIIIGNGDKTMPLYFFDRHLYFNNKNKSAHIEIFDISGRMISNHIIKPNTERIELNLNSNALYIAKYSVDEQMSFVKFVYE